MHGLCVGRRGCSEGGRAKQDDFESGLLVIPRGLVKPRRPHHHPLVCWRNLPVLCAREEVRTGEWRLAFHRLEGVVTDIVRKIGTHILITAKRIVHIA